MLGSFIGQFAGAKPIVFIMYTLVVKGQTNHGSGNVFLGNETDFTNNADVEPTTYNNKFAAYKTNFTGIPSTPLIGGDFAAGVVGTIPLTLYLLPEGVNNTSFLQVKLHKIPINELYQSLAPFTLQKY